MRFVPAKTAEQQAALMLVGVRDQLISNRTQLANAVRGHAAEFGLTAAKGMAHLVPLLERIQADESLPALARELFAMQAKEYAQLQAQIVEVDAKLMTRHKADECSRRLAKAGEDRESTGRAAGELEGFPYTIAPVVHGDLHLRRSWKTSESVRTDLRDALDI
jgi:transposase